MEQDIRFCEFDGRRIAYASVGEGPVLLFGGRWVTHLEEEWDDPRCARLLRRARADASRRPLRPARRRGSPSGTLPSPPSAESEARQLETVLDACTDGAATLFACSCAGLATARLASSAPERVDKIVFFGGYASRDDIPEATRRSLVDFARMNWMLAAQMLAGLFVPRAGGDEIEALSRYQRHAADADVAAAFLELDLASDARAVLPRVTAPALVLHRRGDSTVPISRGRELASLAAERALRHARRRRASALEGRAARAPACPRRLPRRRRAPEANGDSPLSGRETEVLRLVAAGLSNREIASVARPERAHRASPRREPPAEARRVVSRRRRGPRDARRLHLSAGRRAPARLPVHATHVRSASVAAAR